MESNSPLVFICMNKNLVTNRAMKMSYASFWVSPILERKLARYSESCQKCKVCDAL